MLPSSRRFPQCAWNAKTLCAVWPTGLAFHNDAGSSFIGQTLQAADEALWSLCLSAYKGLKVWSTLHDI